MRCLLLRKKPLRTCSILCQWTQQSGGASNHLPVSNPRSTPSSRRGRWLTQEALGLLPSLKLQAIQGRSTNTNCHCRPPAFRLEGGSASAPAASIWLELCRGEHDRDPQKRGPLSSWSPYNCCGHRKEEGKKSDHGCIFPHGLSQRWGVGMAPRRI